MRGALYIKADHAQRKRELFFPSPQTIRKNSVIMRESSWRGKTSSFHKTKFEFAVRRLCKWRRPCSVQPGAEEWRHSSTRRNELKWSAIGARALRCRRHAGRTGSTWNCLSPLLKYVITYAMLRRLGWAGKKTTNGACTQECCFFALCFRNFVLYDRRNMTNTLEGRLFEERF